MRLKLLFLFIVGYLLSSSVYAQRVTRKGSQPNPVEKPAMRQLYDLSKFEGKWQEIKRTRGGNRIVDFTDTLFFHFYSKDSATTRSGLEMSHRGVVQLEGSQLVVAGDEYTIIRFVQNMILDDGTFIRTMEKRNSFYSESLGNIKVPVDDISTPLDINAELLMGKWDVYRTKAKPGTSFPNDAIIRSIEFTGSNPIEGKINIQVKGEVKSLPFNAVIENKMLKITAETNRWEMNIYKVADNELIFGTEGEIVYYAKQH